MISRRSKLSWVKKCIERALSSEWGLIYNYYYWYRTSLWFLLVILYLLPGINQVNNKGSCTATYNTKTINRPLRWRLTRTKENECRFSDCVSSMVKSWVGSSWGRKIAIGVVCVSGGHWCCCCVAVNPRKGGRDQRSWLEENLSCKSLFVAPLLNALHSLHLRLTWWAFSPSLWITTGRQRWELHWTQSPYIFITRTITIYNYYFDYWELQTLQNTFDDTRRGNKSTATWNDKNGVGG